MALMAVVASAGCGVGIGSGEAPDLPAASVLDLNVLGSALERATAMRVDSSTAAVCLSTSESAVPGWASAVADLVDLVRAPVPVVLGPDCPPTYARMIGIVDSLGRPADPPRPPGYVDPYRLEVMEYDGFAPDSVRVIVRLLRGMGGEELLCTVRGGTSGRAVRCASHGRRWIH